jgi:predicted alpha/beta superfamily hydrolase
MDAPLRHWLPIEQFELDAPTIGDRFRIQIMRPVTIDGESVSFPTLYLTDANMMFDAAAGIARSLQGVGDGPRFNLVGIGYPGDGFYAGALLRARDLTFPAHPLLSVAPPPIAGLLEPRGNTRFHGGEAFQDFIADTLIPRIERDYPCDSGQRYYFGHSAGGTFGLLGLIRRSDLFKGYLLSSPGLAFNGRSSAGIDYRDYDFAIDALEAFAASAPKLEDVRLYLSAGSQEGQEPSLAAWNITHNVDRLAARLAALALPGLEVFSEIIPGEYHASVWPIAFIRGVRALLGDRPIPIGGQG